MRKWSLFCIISLSISPFSGAQEENPVLEIRRLESAPVVDGKLDEVWRQAAVGAGLYQLEPLEGKSMTEKTAIYAGYDSDNLYFAFEAEDSRPDLIRSQLSQREQIFDGDVVGVLIDTFGDSRRAYEFFANPLGIQADAFNLNGNEDSAPDFVWHSRGELTASGYIVELRIPFKSLRFSRASGRPWRISFFRNIQRKNEKGLWPAYRSDRGGILTQFAVIKGLSIPDRGTRLEIIPEVTASHAAPYKPQDASAHLGRSDMRAGASMRYGLTPDWTLDTAVNPDFSQVETDAPQLTVNQRYAVYYPEKRPFFMEGADIFSTPINVVHTRTVSDLSYGVKLTGKEGRYTGGAILANDRAGSGSTASIVRLKKDLGSQSSIGIVYSGRELSGAEQNRVGGIDGEIWLGKISRLSFQGLGSYFDRAAGRDTGSAVYANLWRGNRDYDLSLGYTDISPDFIAENGYIERSDMRERTVSFSYKFWQDGGPLVYWQPGAGYTKDYDYSGKLTDEDAYMKIYFSFPCRTNVSAVYRPATLERFGGVNFMKQTVSVSAYSEPFKWLLGSAAMTTGDGIYYDAPAPFLGDKTTWDLSMTLKPSAAFQLSQNLINSRFNSKQGGRIYSENIWQTKASMQWSRETSGRIIYRYSVLNRTGFVDALVSRTLVPGTAVHAGYNIGFAEKDGVLKKTTEMMFTKISYLFRF
ncbi:MAG: DUF5916 domain-containing protein [Elusimicrobiales bacterium]